MLFVGGVVLDAFFLATVFGLLNPRIAAADVAAIFFPFLGVFFLAGDFFTAALFAADFFGVFFVAAMIN
jgi:hypothetical protein